MFFKMLICSVFSFKCFNAVGILRISNTFFMYVLLVMPISVYYTIRVIEITLKTFHPNSQIPKRGVVPKLLTLTILTISRHLPKTTPKNHQLQLKASYLSATGSRNHSMLHLPSSTLAKRHSKPESLETSEALSWHLGAVWTRPNASPTRPNCKSNFGYFPRSDRGRKRNPGFPGTRRALRPRSGRARCRNFPKNPPKRGRRTCPCGTRGSTGDTVGISGAVAVRNGENKKLLAGEKVRPRKPAAFLRPVATVTDKKAGLEQAK